MATNQAGMNSSSGASSTTSVQAAAASSTNHYSSVQRQIQQDWSNREYIEIVISNIKKLTDFLNSFELSCRSKMAILDEKLTKLERSIEFVEAKVTKGETLNWYLYFLQVFQIIAYDFLLHHLMIDWNI